MVQYVGGRAVLIGISSSMHQDKLDESCPGESTKGLNFTSIPAKMDWIVDTITKNNWRIDKHMNDRKEND